MILRLSEMQGLLRVIGFGSLTSGHWLRVIGFGSLASGHWLRVIGFGSLASGHWLRVRDVGILISFTMVIMRIRIYGVT